MSLWSVTLATWWVWVAATALQLALGFRELRSTFQSARFGKVSEHHRYTRFVFKRLRSSAYGQTGRRERVVMWASRVSWVTGWTVVGLIALFIGNVGQ